MLTIATPTPPPTVDRLADLRGQFDHLFSGLADLQAGITVQLAHAGQPGPGRSALAEERDVRRALNRLTDMVNQGQRELNTDRPFDALQTLQAVHVFVDGELKLCLRRWFLAERDPAARALLDTWLEDLENAEPQEMPCSS